MSMDLYPQLAYGFTIPTLEVHGYLGLDIPDEHFRDLNEAVEDLINRPYTKFGVAIQHGEDRARAEDYQKTALIYDVQSRVSLSRFSGGEADFTLLGLDQVSPDFLKFVEETKFSAGWHYWVDCM